MSLGEQGEKMTKEVKTTLKHLLLLSDLYDGIVTRCTYKTTHVYRHYGKLGIRMCKLWRKNKLKFIFWALKHGWEPGKEIDRVPNDASYFPSRCRFVSHCTNLGNRKHGNGSRGFGGRRYSKLPLNVSYDRRPSSTKNPYIVYVARESCRVYVGRFGTIAEAVRARNKAIKTLERKLYGSVKAK